MINVVCSNGNLVAAVVIPCVNTAIPNKRRPNADLGRGKLSRILTNMIIGALRWSAIGAVNRGPPKMITWQCEWNSMTTHDNRGGLLL